MDVVSVSLLLLLVVFGYYMLKKSPQHNLAPMVPGYPLLGSIEMYFDLNKFIAKNAAKYGNVFCFKVLGRLITVVGEKKGFYMYYEKGPDEIRQTTRIFEVVFGAHEVQLATAGSSAVVYDDVDRWLNQWKSHVLPALTPQWRRTYFDLAYPFLLGLLDSKKQGEVIEGFSFFQEFTVSVVGRIVLGTSHPQLHSKFKNLRFGLQKYMETAISPIGMLKLKYLKSYKPIAQAPKDLARLFEDLINKKRTDPESLDDNETVFGIIVRKSITEGFTVPANKLSLLFVFFVIAASLNLDVAIFWTFYHIVTTPKALAEATQELAQIDGPLTYEAADKLQFIHKCIKETIRLKLNSFGIRVVVADQNYNGSIIPKGSLLGMSTLFSHFNENIFPNASEFNPWRFDKSLGPEASENSKYNFIGFGHGHHKCIGENFAYMIASLAVGHILKFYNVDVKTTDPVPTKMQGQIGLMPPASPFLFALSKK